MSYHDAGEYYYGVVYSSVNLKNGAMEPVLEMIYTTKSPE